MMRHGQRRLLQRGAAHSVEVVAAWACAKVGAKGQAPGPTWAVGAETESPAEEPLPSDAWEAGGADWVAQMGQTEVVWNLDGVVDSRVQLLAQAGAVGWPRGVVCLRARRGVRSAAVEELSGPRLGPQGAAPTAVSFCLSTRWFAQKQTASVVCAWSPSGELYQECPHIPEAARQLTGDQQGTSLHLLLKTSAPIRRVPAPLLLHAPFRSGSGTVPSCPF